MDDTIREDNYWPGGMGPPQTQDDYVTEQQLLARIDLREEILMHSPMTEATKRALERLYEQDHQQLALIYEKRKRLAAKDKVSPLLAPAYWVVIAIVAVSGLAHLLYRIFKG